MAFLLYKKTAVGQSICYEKINSLKLGGRDGLISQHVKTLPPTETSSWKMSADGIIKLAGLAAPGNKLVVLFDSTARNATNACLYELSRIHGSCRETCTQLALDFTVVVDKEIGGDADEFARKFEVIPPAMPRLFGETLALTGGPGGGDWKWASTSLQLGATVVQARHRQGTGAPCPDCSCGRCKAMK